MSTRTRRSSRGHSVNDRAEGREGAMEDGEVGGSVRRRVRPYRWGTKFLDKYRCFAGFVPLGRSAPVDGQTIDP